MSNHNIAPQPVPSSPQQYQPQQPQPQPPQPQHLHTTICGIAAVVFGALGLVLSFIPIVNNIAAILGFIGVILAIIAIVGTFDITFQILLALRFLLGCLALGGIRRFARGL